MKKDMISCLRLGQCRRPSPGDGASIERSLAAFLLRERKRLCAPTAPVEKGLANHEGRSRRPIAWKKPPQAGV
jgi:hypothetical protein